MRDTNVYTDVDGSRQPAAERAKKIVWADGQREFEFFTLLRSDERRREYAVRRSFELFPTGVGDELFCERL